MSYQAVLRNTSSVLITSAPVGMRISILQSSGYGSLQRNLKTQLPILMAGKFRNGSGIPVTSTLQALIGQTVLTINGDGSAGEQIIL
jgi:hypothetical protein